MRLTFAELLDRLIARAGLPVSRISSQARIPKQTVFNWLGGRVPRWHANLPQDLERLSRTLGLNVMESEQLLLAAGCHCAVDTSRLEEDTMAGLTMPKGWIRAGSHPNQYDMGLDPEMRLGELLSAGLRSRRNTIDGFGTLMQMCKPGAFIGERVRFSARVRTADVDDWAGLWFRIDGPEKGQSLRFDNMQDRPLKGTQEWAYHAVVLDVPSTATALAFGVLLSGVGRVWITDVRLEKVGQDVPSTNLEGSSCSQLADSPNNLDFTH